MLSCAAPRQTSLTLQSTLTIPRCLPKNPGARLFHGSLMRVCRACLCRGQCVDSISRWLNAHYPSPTVIYLAFDGYPAAGHWVGSVPALGSPAGRALVLRVTCTFPHTDWPGQWDRRGRGLPEGLPHFVAEVLPVCQNLTALHLGNVELGGLPALPCLAHLVLEGCVVVPELLASFQSLLSLETLYVSGYLGTESLVWEVVMVPASLRALRIEAVCGLRFCARRCQCPAWQHVQDLTFCLHAGLERLCLALWDVRVGLQCMDAGVPAGILEMSVQALELSMCPALAAEVGRRGRTAFRPDYMDSERGLSRGSSAPPMQAAIIGEGPVYRECRNPHSSARHRACTCGACAECLGPEAFGGAASH